MSAPYYLRFLRRPSLTGGTTTTLAAGAPIILYTDIISGPTSGAPGGDGCFLSIFGYNFGSVIGNITVTIGGGAVASNVFLGDAYSQMPGMKWLAVQLGASCVTGAIKVTVSGVDSNTDQNFTVRSGTIAYYTTVASLNTAMQAGGGTPGAFYVLRGGTYDDQIYFHTVTGTAGNPITVQGYPGETVLLNRTGASDVAVQVFYSGDNGTQGFYVYSNLKANMNGAGGSIFGLGGNEAVGLQDIRCVNCEGQGMFENAGGSAAFSGSAKKLKVLGCYAHDNDGSKLYHAFYFDGRAVTPDDIEIAYNNITRQKGGRGIQVYGDAGHTITNVNIHHNWVHNIHLDGILLARDNGTGFKVWNNIVEGCGDSTLVHPTADDGGGGYGIRLTDNGASNTLSVEIYNNTLYRNDVDGVAGGEIAFEKSVTTKIRNNIVYAINAYSVGTNYGTLTSSNNLWRNAGAAPSFDTSPRTGDPKFNNAAAHDFTIQAGGDGLNNGTSAVSAVVLNDFLGKARTTYDIGVYEGSV